MLSTASGLDEQPPMVDSSCVFRVGQWKKIVTDVSASLFQRFSCRFWANPAWYEKIRVGNVRKLRFLR